MRLIGFILYALAAALWMGGGRSVVIQHRRRTGTAENFPFRASLFPWRDFDGAERRKLLGYYLGAMLLGFIGSAFANGVFGP